MDYDANVTEIVDEYMRMAKLENEMALRKIDLALVKDIAEGVSFSLVEAAEVLGISENVEEDSGLWGNVPTPEEALQNKAFWTFCNDIVEKLREKGIKIK